MADGKVIIKKEAFRNMITHVLRFGNEALDESIEVMGILVGKKNGKDIDIINAIPITHGKKVSLGFTSEDYNSFSEIEKRYASHNMIIVGWYSSHPGWGLFFSDTAIKNHRFFQKESNPDGFYIVFDYKLMGKEGGFGFEIYRLNNYVEGNEHYTVEFELEQPNTLEYFKWVQKFVEDTQKESPILIKEIYELAEPAPSELQEIPKPEEPLTDEVEVDDYAEIVPIISGFQDGISQFKDIFADTFKSQLNTWTQDIKNGSLTGTKLLKNATSRMKNKISTGMSRIENWFSSNLNEIVINFRENINHYIDDRISNQKDLTTQVSEAKEEIITNLNDLVDGNFSGIIDKIDPSLNKISNEITNSIDLTSNIENSANKSLEFISNIMNEIKIVSEEIEPTISSNISSLEQNMISEIEKLDVELNRIGEIYKQMDNSLKKLQDTFNSLEKQ